VPRVVKTKKIKLLVGTVAESAANIGFLDLYVACLNRGGSTKLTRNNLE